MTYEETKKLFEQIIDKQISIKDAKALYFTEFSDTQKRPWHTKDWKERRGRIIKDKCEICGSTETLTLQHLSHPQKYFEYEKAVAKEYSNETNVTIDEEELTAHVKNNFEYFPIDMCPKCGHKNTNERTRKKPRYLCTECHHEFDKPMHKTVEDAVWEYYNSSNTSEISDKCFVSKNEYRNRQNLYQIVYWLKREKVKSNNKDSIEREAFLRYLQENIKYLSFEDTITCCRRCAFYYDLKSMELCPVCKKFYKGIQYPTCIQCLPEDKRKAALENIEFTKAMEEMDNSWELEEID